MSDLGTIRANVRRNLGETSAQFYQNAELNQYIGEGFKKYYRIMIQEGDGYFETTTNLALVADVEAIDLSVLDPVFNHISAVERRTTSGGTRPLIKSQRRYTSNSTFYTGVSDGYLPTYKLRGLNLILEPAPQQTEAASATTGLKFDYVYVPEFPVAGSLDAFEFDGSFSTVDEPLVELFATIRALESKDGMGGVSDISSFRDTLAELEATFRQGLERSEITEEVQYIGESYDDNIFY